MRRRWSGPVQPRLSWRHLHRSVPSRRRPNLASEAAGEASCMSSTCLSTAADAADIATLAQQLGSALLLSPDEFISAGGAGHRIVRRATRFPRFITAAIWSRSAGSLATGRTCRRGLHRWAAKLDAFSRARSRAISRWCNRREWSWCSTSAPPFICPLLVAIGGKSDLALDGPKSTRMTRCRQKAGQRS